MSTPTTLTTLVSSRAATLRRAATRHPRAATLLMAAATPPTRSSRGVTRPPTARAVTCGRPGRLHRRDQASVPEHLRVQRPRVTVGLLVVRPGRTDRLGGRSNPRRHLRGRPRPDPQHPAVPGRGRRRVPLEPVADHPPPARPGQVRVLVFHRLRAVYRRHLAPRPHRFGRHSRPQPLRVIAAGQSVSART